MTLLLSTAAAAQENAPTTFMNRIHVRHNLNSTKEVAQPAFFQLTFPAEADRSASVGIGLKIDLVSDDPLWSVGPFGEFLWNTATDKEQNNLRAGFDAEWQVLPIGPAHHTHSPVFVAQASYRRDRFKEKEGYQASLLYTHVFRASRWPLPNTTLAFGEAFDLTYSIHLGAMLDGITSAEQEDSEGLIWRGVSRADVGIYPLAQKWERRLELAATHLFHGDISDPTSESDDSHPLLKLSLNTFLVKNDDRAAGFGISYVDGEDPTAGFDKQEYLQVGFVLRMK